MSSQPGSVRLTCHVELERAGDEVGIRLQAVDRLLALGGELELEKAAIREFGEALEGVCQPLALVGCLVQTSQLLEQQRATVTRRSMVLSHIHDLDVDRGDPAERHRRVLRGRKPAARQGHGTN